MADSAFDGYTDSEEISIYAIARSISVAGISMSAEMVEEVQLHES